MPEPVFRPRREPIRWLRLLPTAALCIASVALIAIVREYTGISSLPAVSASEMPVSQPEGPLGLDATLQPKHLEIRWKVKSKAILDASKGEVKIEDGGITEVVPLDKSQLRDGHVVYRVLTNDVSVRMIVSEPDGGSITESIRVISTP